MQEQEKLDHAVRIAVAESKLDSHSQLIENNQELTARLVTKLDAHIIRAEDRDSKIQERLSEVTVAVTQLSGTVADATTAIKSIVPIVQDNNLTLVQWDAVKRTVIAVATVVSILVTGGWALFKFVVETQPNRVQTEVVEEK